MSEELEVRVARIESHVEHIDKVTTDLQAEQRRTNDKIDKLRDTIDDLKDGINATTSSLKDEINATADSLKDGINAAIHSLKDRINATTVWALLLYFALAGTLLGVMAKGFKWI